MHSKCSKEQLRLSNDQNHERNKNEKSSIVDRVSTSTPVAALCTSFSIFQAISFGALAYARFSQVEAKIST